MASDVFDSIATKELQAKNVKFASDAEVGSLADSAAADILCDMRLPVVINGTTFYLALYDTPV